MKKLLIAIIFGAISIGGFGQAAKVPMGVGTKLATAFPIINKAIDTLNTYIVQIPLKLDIADTSAMLAGYARLMNPLFVNFVRVNSDTLATRDYVRATIAGGGVPGILAQEDSLGVQSDINYVTKYRLSSVIHDSATLRLYKSDTASMLLHYVDRTDNIAKLSKTDTATMLAHYAKLTGVALKLNISDTAGMLTHYIDRTDNLAKVSVSDTATMLTKYARKLSPTLTGTPLAPTAAAGTNTTQIATTAFVRTAGLAKVNVADSVTGANSYATDHRADLIELSLSNIKTGVFDVLDYGANRTDTAVNSTAAIQAAIDAAVDGIVYIPQGIYRIDSLRVNNSTNIIGSGWGDNGTTLYSRSSMPMIHIVNRTGEAWSYGCSIKNMTIKGSDRADNGTLRQTGLLIDTEGDVLIEGLYITMCGDYAIRLASNFHADKISINKCRIGNNTRGGIYGRSIPTKQINAIHIFQNEININHGHGINIVGNNVIIRDNIIQSNDSAGVMLSARDMGAVTCNSANTVIEGNYMEENAGGNIKVEVYYNGVGPVYKYHDNLNILNNYILLTDGTAYPATTAAIIFQMIGGGSYTSMYKGMNIKGNWFTVDGAVKRIAFNNTFSKFVTLEVNRLDGLPITTYYDLTSSGLEGGRLVGDITGRSFAYTAPTAVGGITVDYFYDVIDVFVGSAIDISADPQISPGFKEQVISIQNNSDVNTLKLDDGTGLQLAGGASFTMGAGDVITLRYNGTVWIEVSRSDN